MTAGELFTKARCEGCGKKGGAHRKKCPALHATIQAAGMVRRAARASRKPKTVEQILLGKRRQIQPKCQHCGRARSHPSHDKHASDSYHSFLPKLSKAKSHYVGHCHCGGRHRSAFAAHRASVSDRKVTTGRGISTIGKFRPFQTRAPKSGHCQVSLVAQTPVCTSTATAHRNTGKKVVALCAKHDEKYGHVIGAQVTKDRGASTYDSMHGSYGQPGIVSQRPHKRVGFAAMLRRRRERKARQHEGR